MVGPWGSYAQPAIMCSVCRKSWALKDWRWEHSAQPRWATGGPVALNPRQFIWQVNQSGWLAWGSATFILPLSSPLAVDSERSYRCRVPLLLIVLFIVLLASSGLLSHETVCGHSIAILSSGCGDEDFARADKLTTHVALPGEWVAFGDSPKRTEITSSQALC